MRLAATFLGVVVVSLLTIAMLFTAGWTHPPIVGQQNGYRGTAMVQLTTPAALDRLQLANALPDPIAPVPPGGDRAVDVYKNVQVLTDLSADQFNRVMAAITEWVAPQQGCGYCHNTDNMADDGVYAKKVARRMLQMTRHINTEEKAHVGTTGVVCYTCHRGNPVPANVFYQQSRLAAGRRLRHDQSRHGPSGRRQRIDRPAAGSVHAASRKGRRHSCAGDRSASQGRDGRARSRRPSRPIR